MCEFEYCETQEDVFGCVDQSIRAHIIIEGEKGLNFARLLFSGVSFNNSICGIIIYYKEEEKDAASDLEAIFDEWKQNESLLPI